MVIRANFLSLTELWCLRYHILFLFGFLRSNKRNDSIFLAIEQFIDSLIKWTAPLEILIVLVRTFGWIYAYVISSPIILSHCFLQYLSVLQKCRLFNNIVDIRTSL